jgi:hypothetical protein
MQTRKLIMSHAITSSFCLVVKKVVSSGPELATALQDFQQSWTEDTFPDTTAALVD